MRANDGHYPRRYFHDDGGMVCSYAIASCCHGISLSGALVWLIDDPRAVDVRTLIGIVGLSDMSLNRCRWKRIWRIESGSGNEFGEFVMK